MKKHNYGGVYDIDPNSFWTRDDVNDLAYAIEENLQAQANSLVIRIDENYIDHDNVVEIVFTHQDTAYTVKQQIDMRKITSPNDLKEKYAPIIKERILQVINEEGAQYD